MIFNIFSKYNCYIKATIFGCFFLCISFKSLAQIQQKPIKDTIIRNGKTIQVISAERYNFQQIDSVTKMVSLVGKAIVQQEKTLFYADSIVLNQTANTLEAFGHVHINDDDSIHTYADYLKYVGKEKKAYLNKNVKLTDGKGVLTTNSLLYDLQLKIGSYANGGKVINKKTILTSTEGFYYGETKDIYFKKKVVLNDPEYKMYTDTLLYNTNTEISTFIVKTKIIQEKRTIIAKDGYYDVKNKKALFNKRPFIDDSTFTFTAERAIIDDKTGLSEYEGNAVYKSKDSANGYDLIAGNIKINRTTNTLLATIKPILFLKQPKDTIFITADTLYSSKVSALQKIRFVPNVRDTSSERITTPLPLFAAKIKKGNKKNTKEKADSSNDRFFEAYYNVKIFSDSLQAVCDSLFYSLADSTFRLYKNPVAWSQDNQISGDTMLIFVQNKKPERLFVNENAMTIQKVGANFYNQVKGNTINGYFIDGQMNFLRAKGNAETVYYGVDDFKKFVGVNKASCDMIDVFFNENKNENKPHKILLINNLNGTAYPIGQVNHETLKLRKFNWQIQRKPNSKFDIFKGE